MTAQAPFFSIELVRGGDVTRLDLSDAVERFQYVDRERAADKLTLSVNNADLSHFDDPIWKKGALLDVTWGYPGSAAPARRCVITKVTGGRTLAIEALGEEVLMTSVRKTRTFERMTRSEVVGQIARENGFFQLQIQSTPVRYDTIVQSRRTDAEMVRRLANREGFQWYVDWDGFHWHERQVGQRPVRVYYWEGQPGSAIGDVLDFDVENDVTARPGRVRLRGRNPETGETFEAEASNETDTERDVLAPVLAVHERPNLDTGVSSYNWDESDTPEVRMSQEEVRPTSAPTVEAATREARARFRNAQQAAVKMNLDLIGDPRLLAKVVVECRGFGRRLSVRYYVKEVTHTLDVSSGYKTRGKLISDGHGGHSTESTRARGLSAFGVGSQSRGRRNEEEPPENAVSSSSAAGDGPGAGDSPLTQHSRIDLDTGVEVVSWGEMGGRERLVTSDEEGD